MSVLSNLTDHAAARALIGRHRLRWWEPLPWLLALAYFFLFPRYLGFGTELLITVLFAISLDLALGYAGIVNYAVLQISPALGMCMACAAFAEWVIVGTVIGLVYKPAVAVRSGQVRV